MTDLRRSLLLVLPLVVAACATPLPAAHSRVDRRFAEQRPTMVALRVEGAGEDFSDALYGGLIEKNYGVLAPGEPAGSEAGTFRAAISGSSGALAGEAEFLSTAGKAIYTASVTDFPGSPTELAAALLADLPWK